MDEYVTTTDRHSIINNHH